MSEEETTYTVPMISAFEGWNDACQAATNVVHHLIEHYESNEIRHIRCDGFYDYQVARPISCSAAGRRRLLWPQTTFYEIIINPTLRIYAQIAPEPNYRWIEYCRQSLHIAEEFDVDHIITLGSMFADCPHTRPLPVDVSDGGCQCEMDREYNGPVGIPTVLDSIAGEEGFGTTTMWASIPQYLGSDECAQGTLQMIRRLSAILGVSLDEGDLPGKAEAWKAQASILVRCNDELSDYVRNLEHDYDLRARALKMSQPGADQAEQLVKEAEAYLKNIEH